MAVISDQVRDYERFLFQKRLPACGKRAMNRVQHPFSPASLPRDDYQACSGEDKAIVKVA
jgi:hypothetical protein